MLKSLSGDVFGIDVDPQQGGMSLADFEWRYRVLVIFPDDAHIEATRQANMLLSEAEGLRDRDIIVLEVRHNDVKALFGPEYDLNCYAIRADLDITDGFFALKLVGKDGTIRFSSNDVVTPNEIFALIDQIPVRKKERPH
ncbi:DUF4174 domain-containing protein [Pararhizobium sp. O133]|uniref:DUF4174 domain-containing protein n=1 Tax=Pararhizobium sp. O133 TaxID=3449278 RepID=UPI003F683D86